MSVSYQTLEAKFRRLSLIDEAVGMLRWDMSVMMPDRSSAARGEQIANLKLIAHEILSSSEVADFLADAENASAELDEWQIRNLQLMRRRWLHTTAVPEDLLDAFTRSCVKTESVWRMARHESNFVLILPELENLLGLVREVAKAKSEVLGIPPYEALLDSYEQDIKIEQLDALFDDYALFLPAFLEDVLERQSGRPVPHLPQGPFLKPRQAVLCRRMAEAVGFDFSTGRLDATLHPFSGGIPEDSRITTRYDEADFTSAMMGVLHETGHAMYERGRPLKWRYQPIGETAGLGMHESQSLIVEMQASRSRSFFSWAAPVIRDSFAGSGKGWDADNLYRLATRVERSFIRVDADEVTYPAHVALRYRLERAMIDGDLLPRDLPSAWEDQFKQLLAISPPNDQHGCLQDIHWYDGAWGYFPTYSIGAMAAAQLFAAARESDPNIVSALGRGDFSPLMRWLRKNVHDLGARFTTNEILQQATGQILKPEAFKAHLRTRYLDEA
ncbi:MAG: carboxypeptidase M32 [Rickettsiales bacterium]|nr:carboxypeptidase M32 [Rickettsiales bacterium]